MMRVLRPDGDSCFPFIRRRFLHLEEDLWGTGASTEVTLFRASTIAGYMRDAGFELMKLWNAIVCPEVEYQSRRA